MTSHTTPLHFMNVMSRAQLWDAEISELDPVPVIDHLKSSFSELSPV
jgi:hypothetical protein